MERILPTMRSAGSYLATALLCLSSVLAAACGEVVQPGGDDMPDIDAPEVDMQVEIDAPAPGTVTVVATQRTGPDQGLPAPDVQVFATFPDGSTSSVVLTNSSGTAELDDVPFGSSVTAIDASVAGDPRLVTFLHVSPGDTLRVGGEPFGPGQGDPNGTMTITVPAVTGATNYTVFHQCGSNGATAPTTSITISGTSTCNSGAMDLFFVAIGPVGDPPSNQPIRWAFVPDVNYQAGGSFSLSAWQTAGTFSFLVTDLEPEVTEVALQALPFVNNQILFIPAFVETAPSDGMVTANVPWTNGGERTIVLFQAFRPAVGSFARLVVLPPDATSFTAARPAMPLLGPTLASAVARQITWIEVGTGSYDAQILELQWSVTNPDAGIDDFRWMIVAPQVDDRSIAFPAHPASVARFFPGMNASIEVDSFLLKYDDLDYDDLRAKPEWELQCVTCSFDFVDDGPLELVFRGSGFNATSDAPRRALRTFPDVNAH